MNLNKSYDGIRFYAKNSKQKLESHFIPLEILATPTKSLASQVRKDVKRAKAHAKGMRIRENGSIR